MVGLQTGASWEEEAGTGHELGAAGRHASIASSSYAPMDPDPIEGIKAIEAVPINSYASLSDDDGDGDGDGDDSEGSFVFSMPPLPFTPHDVTWILCRTQWMGLTKSLCRPIIWVRGALHLFSACPPVALN